MFACSITPYVHDQYAKDLLKKLAFQGCAVINSAVFNAGFLLGGEYVFLCVFLVSGGGGGLSLSHTHAAATAALPPR